MKLNLNIEEDKELRAYIKDMIKGQVLSIIRSEVKDCLQTVLETKVTTATTKIDEIILNEVKYKVNTVLNGNMLWNDNYIRQVTKEYVAKHINEYFNDQNKSKL